MSRERLGPMMRMASQKSTTAPAIALVPTDVERDAAGS
jgi:hypothetical protein